MLTPVNRSDWSPETVTLAARHAVAGALARAFAEPGAREEATSPSALDGAALAAAWEVLTEACGEVRKADLGLGEEPPGSVQIDPLVRWLARSAGERAAAHEAVFGLIVSKECPPCETEYCHWNDATYRSQQMADIAGFYAAFGLALDPEVRQRPDHVAPELSFVAHLHRKSLALAGEGALADDDRAVVTRDALAAFVRDHVAWWMPTFARCVERRIDELLADGPWAPVHEALGELQGATALLRAWVAVERLAHGLPPSREIIAPRVTVSPFGDEDGDSKADADAEIEGRARPASVFGRGAEAGPVGAPR